MNFPSRGTPEFWRLYRELAPSTRKAACNIYRLWQTNPLHPSLHFKKINNSKWSIRIGIHCRAVGKFESDSFVWSWIGTHAEYDRIV